MKQTERIKNELKTFDENVNVHDLPNIYHYWSNKYLKPILSDFDIEDPDDLFFKFSLEAIKSVDVGKPLLLSIGAGNCDTEVRLAKRLLSEGICEFKIECLELNGRMLERGESLAARESVSDKLVFRQTDCNQWKASETYVAVIANQSLHHIVNLEGVFDEIRHALHGEGAFLISDMIGRNGHQRWPEALKIVHQFWRTLPKKHTYNNQLRRYEKLYENWDCSTEGFEGIRAQDILPLLLDRFYFQVFIGFGNVIDIFIDRGFGHNFNPNDAWDRSFIDKVQVTDENLIRGGAITPTHIMAVLKKAEVKDPRYSRGLSPSFCLRDPGELAAALPKSTVFWKKASRFLARVLSR